VVRAADGPAAGPALVAAGAVAIGDKLVAVAAPPVAAPVCVNATGADGGASVVVGVRAWAGDAGLYAPHTGSGGIAIDGWAASTYTTAVAPRLAAALLAPVRAAAGVGLGRWVWGGVLPRLGGSAGVWGLPQGADVVTLA